MGWGLSKNFEGLTWGCWGPSPGPGTKGWVREVQGHRLYVGPDPPWGSEWKCRGSCPHCHSGAGARQPRGGPEFWDREPSQGCTS